MAGTGADGGDEVKPKILTAEDAEGAEETYPLRLVVRIDFGDALILEPCECRAQQGFRRIIHKGICYREKR